MPVKAILQMPVRVNGEVVRVFRRSDVTLQVPPFPGLGLTGLKIPHVLGPGRQVATKVHEVNEDLDSGIIYLGIQGFQDLTVTAEEVLESLGDGWELLPIEPGPRLAPQPPDTTKHEDW